MDAHDRGDIPSDPLKFQEAIDAFRALVPMTDEEYAALSEAEQEFAFTVANVAQADLVSQVYEAITSAIEDGTTFKDFQVEVGASLADAWGGEDSARLDTIFRTNVMDSYNAGRYEVMTAPAVKEARPYWRFDAISDSRTDDECLDLNGTILHQDDGFWDTHCPPLHFNCRCILVPLSGDEAGDEGIDEPPDDDHPDEGFGARPSSEGSDWEPDPSDYPAPIGNALEDKLGAAG